MRQFKKYKKKRTFNFFKTKPGLHQPDYFLISIVGVILVFGLVMLSSASSVESFRDFGSTYHLFLRQIYRGVLLGLVFLFVLSKIDYHRYEKYSVHFFITSLVLLTAVLIPGIKADFGNASSWISLGPLTFQPTEVVKLLMILFLAGWFAYRGKQRTQDFWNGLFPFVVILGFIGIPVALQPDIGTLSVIGLIAVSIYFAAGARFSHLGILAAGAVGAIGLAIAVAPYRVARLTTFLNPDLDPSGIGYHINQAKLAVGSGGIFGLGFGQSRQKFAYLPEVMGDSIFAIIAEELGFIFASLLILAFVVLAWRGLRLARRTEDDYARFIVVGIISWFAVQAFLNIGAMVGILPLTGIPLPFVSYGGTAMMANLAAVGVLINISRHVKLD